MLSAAPRRRPPCLSPQRGIAAQHVTLALTGVIHEGPLSSMNMGVNNVWQGLVDKRWVLAYAGMWNRTSDGDTSAGAYEPAVMLYTEPINPNATKQYLRPIGVYPARGLETSLKISAIDGNVLSLTAVGPGSRGQTFRFNVATHAYSR